jgi:hypothetical protein
MRKTKALNLKPGTVIIFKDWRKPKWFGDSLGRVEHVTPRGGVLVTPVVECFGEDTPFKDIGPAEWFPYSKIWPSHVSYR